MKIILRDIHLKDEKKAIQFAVKGMHFNWYIDSKIALNIYGRYFWYLETGRATQRIAAYVDGKLAGVLLAEFRDEKPSRHFAWRKIYVVIFEWIQRIFLRKSVGTYDEINRKMIQQYRMTNEPDGELIFLAADPDVKSKGVGSALLEELERRENGKKIFLYTDDACTYQFYERRGFKRVGDEAISLILGKKVVNLRCFLYSKVLSATS